MDPLFVDGLNFVVILIVILKVLVVFGSLLVGTMFMVWFERKLISDMQNRIGPNRAGPFGMLQTLADGIKLFFKEDLVPDRADRFMFALAPFLSFVPAFVTFGIVPIGGVFDAEHGGAVSIFGHDTYLQLADPPIGILLMLGMSSLAIYGVILAGWSSGSKYPLIGSVRASAQMVSYEAALGLSIVAVVLVSNSNGFAGLSTHNIVAAQSGGIVNWNVITTGLVPFVIFLIAATAEMNRPPFDLVEAEQELVGGFNTEYSSIRFALFFLAEFMNVITMSAIMVTLFFGGPSGPVPIGPAWIWSMFWFAAKVLAFLFLFVWFRATLPRIRYDQLMDLGWKVLIPLALGWLLVITAIRIGSDEGWPWPATIAGCAALLGAGSLLLSRAARTARQRRLSGELEEV